MKLPHPTQFPNTYKLLGKGTTRTTYLINQQTVAKLPNSPNDVLYNLSEHNICHSTKHPYPLAKATLTDHNILLMEKVSPIPYPEVQKLLKEDKIPYWVNHTDSYQVGYTAEGKLVCYDYSYVY